MRGKFFVLTCLAGCFLNLTPLLIISFAQQQDESLKRTKEAIQKLDFTKAERLLANYLKLKPQNGEANLLLGQVLFLEGKYSAAIKQLNKVASPSAESGEVSEILQAKARLLLGQSYFKEESKNLSAENYEKAELIAQDRIGENPEFEQILREARAGLEFLDWIAYRTERLTFYYPQFSIVRDQIPQFAESVERALNGVIKLFGGSEGTELKLKIDFYIYNGEQHGRDVLGKPPGFGDPLTKTIHASYNASPVKCLMSVVWPYIAKNTGKHLPPSTLLTESILGAIEMKVDAAAPNLPMQNQGGRFWQRNKDAKIAASLLEDGKLPSLDELLKQAAKPMNRTTPEKPSSNFSATVNSFTSFLAERYGEDKLRDLYFNTGDIRDALQEIYLKPLDVLEKEWRKYVRSGDPKRFEKAILFLQLSTTYLKMELFDLAAEALEKSLEYDDENIPGYFDLISLYERLHKFDAAIDAAQRARAAAEKPDEVDKVIQRLLKAKADFELARAKNDVKHEGELPPGVQLVKWQVDISKPKDEKGPRFSDGNPTIAPVVCRAGNSSIACFHKHGSKEIVGFSIEDGVQLWVFAPPTFPKPKKRRSLTYGYNLGGMVSDGKKIYGFYNKWEYLRRRVRRTAILIGCDVFEIDPANGKQTRRFSLKQPFLSEPSNIVNINGGESTIVCYISGYQGKERDEICVLDLRTARVKWTRKIPAFSLHGYTGAVAFLNKQSLFIGDQDGNFIAYDLLSGEKRWEFKANGSIYASPCGTDDKVFIGCSKGFVYCFGSRDGKLLWKTNVGHAIVNEIRLTGIDDSGSVGNSIFFTTRGNRLYCADAETGQIVWQREMPKAADRRLYVSRNGKAIMTMTGSRDFFGDETPMVSLLNRASGRIQWNYEIEYNAAALFNEDTALVSYGDVYEYNVSKAICLNLIPAAPTDEMKAKKIFAAAEKERQNGDHRLSKALLEKCVELNAESNKYLRALADAYYNSKDYNKAAAIFKKLIERDPDSAQKYKKRLEECRQVMQEDF